MSTYQSRFDVKGRISIPAPFRAVLRTLASDGSATLMLRPSDKLPCIEAWPPKHFELWAEQQKQKQADDPEADEDDLAIRLFSDTVAAEPDKEGRIVLEDFLVQHAGLNGSDTVSCLGLGNRFQLWEPAAVAQLKGSMRQASQSRRGKA